MGLARLRLNVREVNKRGSLFVEIGLQASNVTAITLKIKSSASCCLLCSCLARRALEPASCHRQDSLYQAGNCGRAGKLKEGFFLESTSISVVVQFSPSRNVCTVIQGNGRKQNASKHASCTRRKSETACCMAGQHKLRPSAESSDLFPVTG